MILSIIDAINLLLQSGPLNEKSIPRIPTVRSLSLVGFLPDEVVPRELVLNALIPDDVLCFLGLNHTFFSVFGNLLLVDSVIVLDAFRNERRSQLLSAYSIPVQP